jgi:aryl-alcohol dehydrogenase-like predicted oxidoreductase
MKKRKLGSLEVSTLGLGCMGDVGLLRLGGRR